MNARDAALVKAAKTVSVVLSSMLFVLGVLLVAWPAGLAPAGRFLFGAVLILFGGAKIFGYFTNDLYRIAFQFDLAMGSLVAIFGILLLVLPGLLAPHLSTAVAAYVLLDGLIRVQTAHDAYRFGMHHWYLLLAGALALVGGALAMVIVGYDHHAIWMGSMLIGDAAINFFVSMYTVRVRVRKKNYPLDCEGDE